MPLPPGVPELAALDLLRTVIELGSVSRAADAHGITQPSASSRIRNLERQLGLTLLERSSAGSRPTNDGRLLAEWTDDVLGAAERLAARLAALRADQHGLLRIAASYTVAEYLLPPLLAAFLADRPDDSASLDVTNSREVVRRLENGSADLGFVESPTVPHTIDQSIFAVDELVCVVAPGHPWARRRSVDLATFADTALVQRERGSGTRDALEREMARLGHEPPRTALELGSISAVRVAVVNGSSPTVISRLAVADDIASGRLVEIEVPGVSIERRLRAVWLRRSPLSRLGRAFLDGWISKRSS